MVNKRGLSDVVTTLLIILVALVAVVIIGTIVLRNVGNAGSQLSTTQQCQQIDIYPAGCKFIANGPGSPGNITVARRAGGTDITPFGIKLLIDNAGVVTPSSLYTGANIPAVGATVLINNAPSILLVSSKVSVAAVVAASDGTQITCDPSPVVVACA